MDTPNYYAILTADVRYSKSLKPMEKLLMAEITALTNMNGKCIASNAYFAKLYESKINTVSLWISNLAKNGFINVDLIYKKGTKQVDKRVITLCDKNQIPPSQKSKDNNTLTESNNKGVKKVSEFSSFLKQLKEASIYKTKVTKTKEGERLFKTIEDKKKLFTDYLKHQEEKKEYSVRITAFMEDYKTVHSKSGQNKELTDEQFWGGQ